MRRRTFISRAGLTLAGSIFTTSCVDQAKLPNVENDTSPPLDVSSLSQTRSDASDWERVRRQFNLSQDKIHLSALLISSNPAPVREAIERYRRRLNEDPVIYLVRENDQRQKDVRVAAANYLGGDYQEVALTDSTTTGIAMVYNGLRLQPGEDVLTTEHGYYSTQESLRLKAARTGADVREIRLYDRLETVSEDEIVTRIVRAIQPTTRALALTWVHSSTGLKLPIGKISRAVGEINADRPRSEQVLVCVDGVHGFGVEDVVMDDLGCDFFMAGCHKWLFGPRGTGIIWGRRDAWPRLRPTIPSFMDQASWNGWALEEKPEGPTTAVRMSPGGFKPFEHQWAMADAFRFHEQIGKSRIAERTHELNRQLKEGLVRMSHVTLYTPLDENLSAGIVCFDVDGMSEEAVIDRLWQENIIATTTPYMVSYPRLTPCIYNTPDEVDAALRAIQAMADGSRT